MQHLIRSITFYADNFRMMNLLTASIWFFVLVVSAIFGTDLNPDFIAKLCFATFLGVNLYMAVISAFLYEPRLDERRR